MSATPVNDICEYFESCETSEDCCSGCGNGQCDVYEQSQHALSVSASGFSASEVTVMVGDTLTWSNDTEGPINLICDGNLGHKTVDAQESYETIATESGSFDCRVHEPQGSFRPWPSKTTTVRIVSPVRATVESASKGKALEAIRPVLSERCRV